MSWMTFVLCGTWLRLFRVAWKSCSITIAAVQGSKGFLLEMQQVTSNKSPGNKLVTIIRCREP